MERQDGEGQLCPSTEGPLVLECDFFIVHENIFFIHMVAHFIKWATFILPIWWTVQVPCTFDKLCNSIAQLINWVIRLPIWSNMQFDKWGLTHMLLDGLQCWGCPFLSAGLPYIQSMPLSWEPEHSLVLAFLILNTMHLSWEPGYSSALKFLMFNIMPLSWEPGHSSALGFLIFTTIQLS